MRGKILVKTGGNGRQKGEQKRIKHNETGREKGSEREQKKARKTNKEYYLATKRNAKREINVEGKTSGIK